MKGSKIYGLILLLLTSSCLTFRKNDQRITHVLEKSGTSPSFYRVLVKDGMLRYFSAQKIDSMKPTILFIHGAPGSGMDFSDYLVDQDLQKLANLIAVDRLGYGYSTYGKANTSIAAQAKAIDHIIEKHKLNSVLLFGWSYGVPIAVKLANEQPAVTQAVLVAGAISPKDEKFFALGKLAHWKATRWMFSKALRVADKEKYSHVDELEKLKPVWNELDVPITYYHGTRDKIVPFANLYFIERELALSLLTSVKVVGANHFLAFSHFAMVKDRLRLLLHTK
ncbi:alpha/beta hydrolase [Flavobacteriaceae bacterium F08102]|nr:alpha/beta hydrolase [Flavobacteriaceae bacterium F08102]